MGPGRTPLRAPGPAGPVPPHRHCPTGKAACSERSAAAPVEATVPFVSSALLVPGRGVVEALIGMALLTGRWRRLVLVVLVAHLTGTFLPCQRRSYEPAPSTHPGRQGTAAAGLDHWKRTCRASAANTARRRS